MTCSFLTNAYSPKSQGLCTFVYIYILCIRLIHIYTETVRFLCARGVDGQLRGEDRSLREPSPIPCLRFSATVRGLFTCGLPMYNSTFIILRRTHSHTAHTERTKLTHHPYEHISNQKQKAAINKRQCKTVCTHIPTTTRWLARSV